MNTKQVLYNALQGQLVTKKQAFESYQKTVTMPAFHELLTEVRTFITSFAPIDDSMEIEVSNRSIRVKTDKESYSGGIEFTLHNNYSKPINQWVEVEWYSGSYNFVGKVEKKNYVNILHSVVNNLKLIEDKYINEWKIKYDSIWDADREVQKEYTDLENALRTLDNEIQSDQADAMRSIGFEIKQFKPRYTLDWDYDDDNNTRIYKIKNESHSIRIQTGRSQYDTTWIHGFKVLGKKGNKYNIEMYREGYPDKKCDILEKKFDSFINDVASWEYKQADKRKDEAEKRLAEQTK